MGVTTPGGPPDTWWAPCGGDGSETWGGVDTQGKRHLLSPLCPRMLQTRDGNIVGILTSKPMHVAWLKVWLYVSQGSELVLCPMWVSHPKPHYHHCQHHSSDSILLSSVKEMLHWSTRESTARARPQGSAVTP